MAKRKKYGILLVGGKIVADSGMMPEPAENACT